MISRDEVLRIVQTRGPIIPRHLVKEGASDTIIAGAILSELVEIKKVKLSYGKIGGTPFYYVEGQEAKLGPLLYPEMHEKEQKAYDLLKEKIIIDDEEIEPVIRVALRNLKDFAKPLEVLINENTRLVWKWYLTSDSDAEEIIRKKYADEIAKEQEALKKAASDKKEAEEKAEKDRKSEEEKRTQEDKKELPAKEKITEEDSIIPQPMTRKDETEIKEEIKREIKGEAKQQTLPKEEKPKKIIAEDSEPTSPLIEKAEKWFGEKGVEIIEKDIIRKSSEITYIIKMPSVAGKLNYLCKARSKKKFSDADLSSVYVEGELKKLPILLLLEGELSKKANEMLETRFRTIKVVFV